MNWLKRIDKKIPLVFLGLLLTIAFGIVGIYSLFREKKPNIFMEITNEANVLDIYKPLEELNIFFQGEDIQQKDLNLRILTINIENNGQVDILQNHYDLNDIWGIKVQNGKIIEVRLINSNSEYIKSNLNPQLYKEDTVQFAKVIFEKGKFFTIEILVLHIKYKLPEIIPIGKIAGIDKIVPIKSWLEKEKQTFLSKLFAGNTLVQIIRPIIYLIAWIVFIAIIIALGIGITNIINKTKEASRRNKIKGIFGKEALESGSKKKRLLDIYVTRGPEVVKILQKYLKDEKKIHERMFLYKLEKQSAEEKIGKRERILKEVEHYNFFFGREVIDPLIDAAIVTIGSDKRVHIDSEFKQTLEKLLKLEEKKKK